MSYWSSGEFDENGNYILPRTWDSLPYQDPKKLFVDVNLEKIIKKKENTVFKSRDYYDWYHLEIFCRTAIEFYQQTYNAFSKFYLKNNKNKFIFISFDGWAALDSLASRLDECETNLIHQFNRYKRDVLNTIKKDKDLNSALNYAASAWMMYHVMLEKSKNPQNMIDLSPTLTNSVELKKQNPIDDSEKLNYFNQLLIFQRNFNKSIPTQFLFKNHNWLYKNIDSVKVFDGVAALLGGFTSSTLQEKITELSNEQNYSCQVGQVINYFKSKPKILADVNLLNKNAANWNNENRDINLFLTEDEQDIYQKVEGYREKLMQVYKFANKNLSDSITQDIVKLGKQVSASLNNASQSYSEFQQELINLDKIIEKLKNSRG